MINKNSHKKHHLINNDSTKESNSFKGPHLWYEEECVFAPHSKHLRGFLNCNLFLSTSGWDLSNSLDITSNI